MDTHLPTGVSSETNQFVWKLTKFGGWLLVAETEKNILLFILISVSYHANKIKYSFLNFIIESD